MAIDLLSHHVKKDYSLCAMDDYRVIFSMRYFEKLAYFINYKNKTGFLKMPLVHFIQVCSVNTL